jgi:uncharacterized protein (TIGR02588 family)
VSERKGSAKDKPWLEWAVGAVGALLFIAILGVLLTNALRDTGAAPSISTRVESIEPVDTGYVVKFIAMNDGELTAAQVRLEAELVTPTGERETRELTFDYLPPHSERRGGFIFQNDPRAGALRIEADGYVDP